jgi:hypothetical protein
MEERDGAGGARDEGEDDASAEAEEDEHAATQARAAEVAAAREQRRRNDMKRNHTEGATAVAMECLVCMSARIQVCTAGGCTPLSARPFPGEGRCLGWSHPPQPSSALVLSLCCSPVPGKSLSPHAEPGNPRITALPLTDCMHVCLTHRWFACRAATRACVASARGGCAAARCAARSSRAARSSFSPPSDCSGSAYPAGDAAPRVLLDIGRDGIGFCPLYFRAFSPEGAPQEPAAPPPWTTRRWLWRVRLERLERVPVVAGPVRWGLACPPL